MTRTIHSPRTALAAATLLALLAACESSDPHNTYGVAAVQFQDVVVPTGMRLRERANESYSRDEAGWRTAHLVYTGQVRVEDIESYLRQRMPGHSWELVGETKLEEGGTQLQFQRSIYSAQYQITRGDGATMMVVDYSTDYSRR